MHCHGGSSCFGVCGSRDLSNLSHLRIYTWIYPDLITYTHIHACMHTYAYIYIYVYIYIYIYLCIYITFRYFKNVYSIYLRFRDHLSEILRPVPEILVTWNTGEWPLIQWVWPRFKHPGINGEIEHLYYLFEAATYL